MTVCALLCAMSFAFPTWAYNFAAAARGILHEAKMKDNQPKFARHLYDVVAQVTDNFTKNFTCNELKKYIDPMYLDYMAKHIAQTNENTYVAFVWPALVGYEKEIMRIFNTYCTVIYSKRIFLDERETSNLLAHISAKAPYAYQENKWFPRSLTRSNPLRVYLIECKPNGTSYRKMKKYLIKRFRGDKARINWFEKQYGKRAVQNLYTTTKCKWEIRGAIHLIYGIHVNDMHDETIAMAQLVFA